MIRLFRVSIPSSVVALIFSELILVFSCYLFAAYGALEFSADIFLFEERGIWRIVLVAVLVVLGLYFSDLYEDYRIRSRIALFQQFCLILGIAFIVQALLSYGRWEVILPKWMMLYGSLMVLVLAPSWRLFFTQTLAKAVGARKLLFLGSSPVVEHLVEELKNRPELGLAAIGFLDDSGQVPALAGVPCLGSIDEFDDVVERHRPDQIVVGVLERRGSLPVHQLLERRFSGMRIEDAATTYETVFGRVSTRELRPSQLIFSSSLVPHEWMAILQSIYSPVLALFGAIVLSPVMLLTALLVKVTSPGPVFFRQTRSGKNGTPFTLYKFRSMREDAEAETGAVWATKNDPRITPIGRWLRKLRLDELPQLLNVIRGEMSIVGPRPERPEFVQILQEKIPYYRQRLVVKPGLTGWAQINHKYGDTLDDAIMKLEYDLYYIKNLSLSLDLFIIFRTVKTVLLGRGAQ
jgi:sugar transferase (PEP-CTERM system associated)